jgi:hypothetical protein
MKHLGLVRNYLNGAPLRWAPGFAWTNTYAYYEKFVNYGKKVL